MKTKLRIACAAALFALATTCMMVVTPARAGSGTIEMTLFKAALLVGGTGGHGTLVLDGVSYPLSVGGISAGLSIAFAESSLKGTVKNINVPTDIEGVYSAAGAGVAVAAGGQAVAMTNANGVLIEVAGTQMGVDASLDLTGLTITIKR